MHSVEPMEVSVEARNERLEHDGCPRRTGTFWTASAHITTAVIGSGVLSLAWAIAQLGWVAGPTAMLLFVFVTYYTATLLAECYSTGDPETGKRNYTYMDAIRSNLGGAKVVFCGVIQYANLVGVTIRYTVGSSISMKAIRRDGCTVASYMILFGSGVLSLRWAIAQLGWVAGPSGMLLFAYCVATLLAECYCTGDPETGKRNYIYVDAVRSSVLIRYAKLVGVAIGYTLGMKAIRAAGCSHADPFMISSVPYMSLFGVVQILFSLIPDFNQIWWLSIVAAAMSFTYYSIGLSLSIAQTISSGGFLGNLTGFSIGADVTTTQKIWHTLEGLRDIVFAYYFSNILIESQDTVEAPPPSESKVTRQATGLSVATTTFFYMVCGCMGYAAFGDAALDNVSTVLGFYEPFFWLVGIANIAIVLHLDSATGRRPRMPRTGSTTPDYFQIMAPAIISRPESGVIAAALMCMEADSWFFKVKAEAVESLKRMCRDRGIWKPYVGASIRGVLEVIRSLEKGIPTVDDRISLRLKNYVSYYGQLSPWKIKSLLRNGPVVGVLYAGKSYSSSKVYRGNRSASGIRHVVVCTSCREVKGKTCLIIMDNWEREGPRRIVRLEAFEQFHVLTVDACEQA